MCRVTGIRQSGFLAWLDRSAFDHQQQDRISLAQIRLSLGVVLDVFPRRAVGWATSDRLKRDPAVEAPRRGWFTVPPAGRTTARPTTSRGSADGTS